MMKLLGGKKIFTTQLDSFFTIKALNPNKYLGQEAMIGQYAHGIEPSHHIAYLYAYSDKPERTGELITQICNEFYNNTTTGMIGNDDCGQMSAWYIFSTLGFYPVNPSSGEFVLGMPQLRKAVVRLKDGKKLVIVAADNKSKAENKSVVLFNHPSILNPFITYKMMIMGGELDFK